MAGNLKQLIGIIIGWMVSPLNSRMLARWVFFLINAFSARRSPKESLIFLLEQERYLLSLTGNEACRYGEGVHTKHRHTGYHDFFIKRIHHGEKVLDIGCGNGALSYDLALTGAHVVGMDINYDNIFW